MLATIGSPRTLASHLFPSNSCHLLVLFFWGVCTQEKVACLADNNATLAPDPKDPFAIQVRVPPPHSNPSPHTHTPSVTSTASSTIPDFIHNRASMCSIDGQRDSGFRIQGSGFRVQGSVFMVQDSGFSIHGSGFRFRVQGSGFRIQGSGFSIYGWWCRPSRTVMETSTYSSTRAVSWQSGNNPKPPSCPMPSGPYE